MYLKLKDTVGGPELGSGHPPTGNPLDNVGGIAEECIWGLAEADTFYCQHCPGLCDDHVMDGNNITAFMWSI